MHESCISPKFHNFLICALGTFPCEFTFLQGGSKHAYFNYGHLVCLGVDLALNLKGDGVTMMNICAVLEECCPRKTKSPHPGKFQHFCYVIFTEDISLKIPKCPLLIQKSS